MTKHQVVSIVNDLESKIIFNEWGDLKNRHEVISYAVQTYGISEISAYNHMRVAERRQRHKRRGEWRKP